MQTIAIINKKGGTGKTTTAVNLGGAMAREGLRVLLIDLDPQGSLSYSLGIYKVNYDIANVLVGEVGLSSAIERREGMDVIPSSPDLEKVEMAMGNFHRREEVLKSMLQEISGYDFVIIDCPPGSHILQSNALIAANWVLTPLQIATLNVKGLLQIEKEIEDVRTLYNPGLKSLGVLQIGAFKKRGIFSRKENHQEKLRHHMKESLGVSFLQTTIREDSNIRRAPGLGGSVINLAPQSTGARDYMDLAREVRKRTQIKVLTLA